MIAFLDANDLRPLLIGKLQNTARLVAWEMGGRMKFTPLRENLEGRKVVMVDDSIVRGTTTGQIVRLLKDAGAAEVHVRISSPPVKWPCFYGIDMAERKQLIAALRSVEDIRRHIDADSLGYLSLEGLLRAARPPGAAD